MTIALILFFASLTQAVAGFGLALLSMPLLTEALGLRVAVPLVALVGLTNELVMLVRYRRSINPAAVIRLSAASLIAVPIGVFVLVQVDPKILTTVLGSILLTYAIYALTDPTLPRLAHGAWAYGFGFVAGLLSGAMNTSGPPVVIYGSCRRWSPDEFKGNLQGFFFLNGLVTISSHGLAGNFTAPVWDNYWIALPGLAFGLFVGFRLDSRIDPDRFRKLVLLLLLGLAVRLLWP